MLPQALCLIVSVSVFMHAAGAVCLHVCAKWLLVGRYKPGVYPIYGLHYVAWWIERLLFKVCDPLAPGTVRRQGYVWSFSVPSALSVVSFPRCHHTCPH